MALPSGGWAIGTAQGGVALLSTSGEIESVIDSASGLAELGTAGRHIGQREPRRQELDVPAGHVFVLGDNRDNAVDSRVSDSLLGAGFVPLINVLGVVEPE